MASSSTVAAKSLRLASLPGGPPPTPTSLLDLPQAWLLLLAKCKGLDREDGTPVALFRTCAFFRDAVLRHRTAVGAFTVPVAEEDFPSEVERLCAVARRSSNVRLEFAGAESGDGELFRWSDTEPHITHLLVCAMAQLEGERPLACVKEIKLEFLEQSSLVPAWVKVLCPNATKLGITQSAVALRPLPQPRPHLQLQHLDWVRWWGRDQDPPLAKHVRQQLAALPGLTSLTLPDLDWARGEEEDEQQARRLISCTVTRLEISDGGFQVEMSPAELQRLPTQFPNLRELDADVTVDDAGLEPLLRLPHLERLHVSGFELRRSHAHRALLWRQLTVRDLDVGSFARLPLDGIQACRCWGWFVPSADAAAVARVAQAIRRWGGLEVEFTIVDEDAAALLATLGPLVAALPAEQQRTVYINESDAVKPQQVQQQDWQVPATVTMLVLEGGPTLTSGFWSALLPTLPATVEELWLSYLTEQEALALCQAAVRPIGVRFRGLSSGALDRLHRALHGPGEQAPLVTLLDS